MTHWYFMRAERLTLVVGIGYKLLCILVELGGLWFVGGCIIESCDCLV